MDFNVAKSKPERVTFRLETIKNWPLYATRNQWAKVLGMHYDSLKDAFDKEDLKGDVQPGGRIYHTRKQILAWRAPSLLEELTHEQLYGDIKI